MNWDYWIDYPERTCWIGLAVMVSMLVIAIAVVEVLK